MTKFVMRDRKKSNHLSLKLFEQRLEFFSVGFFRSLWLVSYQAATCDCEVVSAVMSGYSLLPSPPLKNF